ncbi:MAG: regulatory protein RecX [Gammaproteobacteria bacterium]|nr:regulatory protein RecX [Gammaproteobacteria bacterium]
MTKEIRNAALRYLQMRDYSKMSLALKLRQKGFVLDEITPLLEQLVEDGLLNEERFVENYIHYRRGRGFGPERIALELKAQGIDKVCIAAQLDMADNTWLDSARRIWEKQFKNVKAQDFTSYMKQCQFLQRKGFTREQIDAVIPRHFNTEFI